jgi:glyceraldehyde-3-phosphate dehydrogenase (NAD(P))
MVDNQAIVIPETIDAIRALDGRTSAIDSIRMTNEALGISSAIGSPSKQVKREQAAEVYPV